MTFDVRGLKYVKLFLKYLVFFLCFYTVSDMFFNMFFIDCNSKKLLLPFFPYPSFSNISKYYIVDIITQEKINESHDMGNIWVFPSISHSMGKCNKTHRMGKTWEIGNHIFHIAWVLFSHPIPILSYTSSYRKCMGFPINLP